MALDGPNEQGCYYKEFTTCVSGQEYQFKVTDGTWSNTWGYSDLAATVPEGVTGNNDNNIVCTTYDANMTVVFDPEEKKITLTGVFKDASGEGEPSEVVYSIKHGWKDGQNASWSYKDLTPNGDETYSIRDIYGGTGCNWKSTTSSEEKWISSPTLVGSPAVGDSAVFTLTSTTGDGAITITKIGSAGGEGGEGGEDEPSEVVYSIKHGWKDGQNASWSYKDLTPNGDETYSIRDIYGGTGCNWKSTTSSEEKWISSPTLVGSPAVGDSAVFTLTSTTDDGAITITKIVSTDPAVVLTVTGDSKIDSEVTLSAVAGNIEGEVSYKYYVKVDDGDFTALEAANYTFTAAGTYTFKVEAKVDDEVKATDTKEITITNVVTDYYLVGYINGANYGIESDASNLGEYKFVDGKLTVTFTALSYVLVKTGENVFYYSNNYIAPAANVVATLKQADSNEKVGVNANVEVTFTLVNNGDGTLTLSYSTPAVELTVTGNTELGSEVTLSAATSNIEGDVSYKYYVKVDDGDFTALEEAKYKFEALGTYTFKVEAKVGDDVKAIDTKEVVIAYDWYVRGSFTGWEVDVKYGMPKNAEGIYSLSFDLEADTYSFKLSKVNTWDGAIGAGAVNADCSDQGWEGDVENNGDITFTLDKPATVTVTYDSKNICLTSTLGKFGKVVIEAYTIVGDSAIVGKDWAPTYANADMTDKGDGTWVWEIKDRELEAKEYHYKVVGNHAYTIYQFPTDDGNQTLTFSEAGTYDIVYTFKPGETPELTAVATKHSSPVTGLHESVAPVIYTRDGRIYGADDMRIYTVLGMDVTNMNGQLNGIYVVKTTDSIVKVVVR
ncbi:MAG: hypothetical protein ACI392_00925 [Paludibacteraceae bacterium]